MYPQSELDNYKLQVELLQEKLKRSEGNRQQLEQQLEKTLQKRNEHDKQVRAKTRQKYQQFVDEQQKRNERNKKLVQMLERIDEQTAAMSARSERLKMMKMQYEMYFAKLVQSQTMRCIQNTTAATSIPVLLPTAATMATMATVAPAVVKELPTAAAVTTENSPANAPAAATHYLLNVDAASCNPTAATVGALTPHGWTLAMATPTPGGMLLTSTPQAAMATMSIPQDYLVANSYDYLRQPMGYMPRLQQQQLQLLQMGAGMPACFGAGDHLLAAADKRGDGGIDALATLSALDKMNDAAPVATPKTTTTPQQYGNIGSDFSFTTADNHIQVTPAKTITTTTTTTAAAAAAATATALPINDNDNGAQQAEADAQQQLSTMSTAFSTSAPLTFDKLPKKSFAMSEENLARTEAVTLTASVAATAAAATAAAVTAAVEAVAPPFWKPQVAALRFDEFGNGLSLASSGSDKVALPPSRIEDVAEKSSNYAAATAAVALPDAVSHRASADVVRRGGDGVAVEVDANKMRQFDEEQMSESFRASHEDKFPGERGSSAGMATAESVAAAHHQNAAAGFAEMSIANNTKPEMAGGPHPDGTSGNQSSQSLAAVTAETLSTPKVSIENIENAIYGELVNPPMEGDATGASNARQGLLNDFLTQPAAIIADAEQEDSFKATQPTANEVPEYATVGEEEATASAKGYNEDATLDDTANVEAAYSNGDNNENYAQYANNPQPEPDFISADQSYGNYGDSQYDPNAYVPNDYDPNAYDSSAYDPNAYPGYTYDEATGQYTPDSNEQYPAEDLNYGYAADQADPNNDYSNYEQDTAKDEIYTEAAEQEKQPTEPTEQTTEPAEPTESTEPIEPTEAESPAVASAASYDVADPDIATETKTETEAEVTVKPARPTVSILSPPAASKQAAPNDPNKKKKRVNFLDSDTDDNSSLKETAAGAATANTAAAAAGVKTQEGAASSESDFDFSADAERDGT